MTMAQLTIMITASQNGKNPLFGPSAPQPKPRRTAPNRTTPPKSIISEAVLASAARLLLLKQTAFLHQIAMHLLRFFHPLDVRRADGEFGFQRVLFEIFLKFRRVIDFLQEAGVPIDGFLRHIGSAENTAQHQIV